jgi:hypothetical protein
MLFFCGMIQKLAQIILKIRSEMAVFFFVYADIYLENNNK